MSVMHHTRKLATFAARRLGSLLLAASLLAFGPGAPAGAAAPQGGAQAAPITVPFDHFATGFELDGVHRDLPCESCHLNAVFKGTPRQCGTCHVAGSVYNATPKVQNHIQSTNNCAACHDTLSFRPYVHFDHGNVLGACASCHNGTIAQGEGPTHPATTQACEACHTVMSWNPPKTVDHTQIPLAVAGYCIICHNGKAASGKPASHIPTTLECGDCHLTTNWLGATFNHTGIVSNCYSCHNGTRAVGKQGSHMPTTNTCEACHQTGIGTATPSWVPSLFDHTQMAVSTCASCHSGTTKISTGFVSGMPTNHVPPIPAKLDCSVCHGNTPAAETWTVLAASIATLHTGLNVNNCVLCHGGQSFAGVPSPYIPMSVSGTSPTKSTPLSPPHIPLLAGADCSACHGAAYTTGGFGPATAMTAATHAYVSSTCDTCHDTGRKFYTGSGTALQTRPADHLSSGDANMVSGDCSLCHTTANWNSDKLPAGHMPNPSNLGCSTCHTSAPADYTTATLAANPVLHTGISGNCGLCHGNTTTALTWANNFTPKDAILAPAHIPYLAGADCSACHASATYAAGTFGPMNMTQATHAFVPATCNTCHEAGLAFTMGSANPGLQGRPADHTDGQMAAPNDCSICHTTANWNSNFLPAGHMPNPGNQACATCHVAIGSSAASYATLASIQVLHTGITNNCGLCHGTPSGQLTFYNNNDNPKAAVLTPSHIPYLSGTDCSNCHTTNYVAGGFGPMNMTPATHKFVPTTCDSCHEAGLSFYLGNSTAPLQGRPADHTAAGGNFATGDCAACHTPADWSASVLPPGHMPNPANQACATCHTAIGPTFASYATLGSIAALHTGITAATGCAQCHGSPSSGQLQFYNNNDNPKAAVLTPAHIPYDNGTDCSACHALNYTSGGFGPMNMNANSHQFVPTTCDTCHEAGLSFYLGNSTNPLQGRPADHVNTPTLPQQVKGDCSLCHVTSTWVATALPAGHMPNPAGQQCTVCHTSAPSNYKVFASTATLHTGITAATGCAQCHGGATQLSFYNNDLTIKAAASLSPAHIPAFSGEDCSACHALNFVSGGFGPMNMTQATHSGVGSTCNSCHEKGLSFYMGAASPGLQGRPADHTTGNMVAPNDCSLCHTTANWNSTVLPTGHMPNPAGNACAVCHTAAPTDYTTATLAANSVLHTGISGGCGQCHGGTSGALTWYSNYTPKDAVLSPAHIPYTAGTDCSSCHSSTTYAAGTFGPMNMTQAKHSFVSGACNTCHEKGLSFYMGAASPGLQGRPADHTTGQMVAPNDCNLCHTTANWNSNVMPAGHMPNPANSACTVCHTTAPADYTTATLAANSVLHTGITGNCGQCHGSASTPLTWYNNFTPKDAVLSPAHIPYTSGTDCSSCHSSTTYAAGTFGPMNMTQAKHSFVPGTCDTCHEAGLSFYMGAASPGLQGRPADHNTGQMVAPNDCSICHTTANWNSTVLPSGHMPNPANSACTVCHTKAPADYTTTTLAANATLHTGITSGCITCHGAPNAAAPVFYPNYTPKDAILSPVHIPTAATPCEDCHSKTVFTSFSGTTMTSAEHTSMFAYIGSTCDACHNKVTPALSFYGVTNLQTRPNDHSSGNKLTEDCSACHSPKNWDNAQVRPVAKAAVKAASKVSAVVTPATVTATNTATPTGATPVTARGGPARTAGISHLGVTSNCASCHDGVLAQGKGAGHIASNASCENCHTVTAWLPARFDHQGVTASCASCHNGAIAPGKPVRHIDSNQDCKTCHGTLAWLPARFNHTGLAAVCASCHNGITATGKQATHPVTTQDCSACHNTQSWNGATPPPVPLKPLLHAPRAPVRSTVTGTAQ